MTIMITAATPDDLELIMDLEMAGFEAAERWSETAWADELIAEGRIVRVARFDDRARSDEQAPVNLQVESTTPRPIGVAVFRVTGETADLHRIVVAAETRRHGVGARLLADGLQAVRQAGVRSVLAEVRYDNEAAIALYQRAGFEQLGARRDYYGPGAHALILKRYDLDLDPTTSSTTTSPTTTNPATMSTSTGVTA